MRTRWDRILFVAVLLTSAARINAATPAMQADFERQNRELRFKLAQTEARVRTLEAMLVNKELEERPKWDGSRVSTPWPTRLNLNLRTASLMPAWRAVTEWHAAWIPTLQEYLESTRPVNVSRMSINWMRPKMPPPYPGFLTPPDFPDEIDLKPQFRPPSGKP